MDVSIIICTRDRAADLRETLVSLSIVNVPADLTAELIIVDNASTDDTLRTANEFPMPNIPVRVIQEPRKGKSNAYNTGIAAARGDVLLFTDDDLRLPNDWLEAMHRPFRSGDIKAVAGRVVLAPHLERAWMEPVHRYWLAETEPDEPGKQHYMVGANMAFSREILNKIAGFDPELGAGALGFCEETLISKQILAAGWSITFLKASCVEHHFSPDRLSRQNFLETARRRGETTAYMIYHWEHQKVIAPAARMLQKRLEVALWYRRHPQLAAESEGLPTGLMYNLEAYHRYRHYLIERRRPRLYEKQGLTKKGQR